jgi:protein-tyrosine kinase
MERIKEALDRARRERGERGTADSRGAPPPGLASNVQPLPRTEEIRYTQTRVVDTDPALLSRNRIVAGRDRDPAADAFRILRTRVMQVMRGNGWKSLAITSPSVGEGVSLTAINLAISLAREVSQTVLLVDLDLRRPKIHERLGIDVEFGISDYLISDQPLSNALVNPGIERLLVLPGREGQGYVSEMMTTPQMRHFVEEITSRYPERIVIFDLPPVCMSDDVLAFSPLVDAFLLVVRDNFTEQPNLRQAVELLKNVNLVGTVLTASDESPSVPY